jgi:hypothetical protein
MFVLKHAVQHEELLASAVGVRRETAFRRVTHDRGCARDLVSDPVKHPPIDTDDWRSDPGDLRAMHHDTLAEVGIDVGHIALSSTDGGLTD